MANPALTVRAQPGVHDSLRYRIALTVFLLEAVMVAVMLWQTQSISVRGTEAHLEHADAVVFRLLAPEARKVLAGADPAPFSAVLQSLVGSRAREIVLRSDSGAVLVTSGSEPHADDDAHSYWREKPISIAGTTTAGALAVRFSKAQLAAAVEQARTRTIVIALIGMSVIALAGLLIGYLLTWRLERLAAAAARLAAGERQVHVGISGSDEIARLGRSFDRMAETISGQLSALQSSEERNRVLVEHCPAAIFVFDVDAFCLVDVNQKMIELLRYPRDRLIGMTPTEISPPLQQGNRPTDNWALELIERTFAGEHPTAPWALRDSVGRDIPCELQLSRYPSSERNLVIGIIYDVSERERIARALARRLEFEDLIVRLSTRFIGLIPDQIDDGVNDALAEIGRFAAVDRSYVFQFTTDMRMESCTHEWCGPGIEPAIQRLQHLPLADFPWFLERIMKDGILHVPQVAGLPREAEAERKEFEAESIKSVIMVPLAFEGRVMGYMGFDFVRHESSWPEDIVMLLKIAGEIVFNALHRKQSELALQRQALELERINGELQRSNIELQQFAYVASHDLQEPMRAIAGFSALLQRDYQGRLDKSADEYLGFITSSAKRMKGMITDLLDYSRLESRPQALEAVDCKRLLDEASDNLRVAIEEENAIVECDALPRIVGDASQLLLLFQNLISNAIKFHGAEPPRIQVTAHEQKGEWLFVVRDNGIGIPRESLKHVFMMFKRLHSTDQYAGTGIGLAVCKRIVERHGGRIWAESEGKSGSVFYFTLPKSDAAPAEPTRRERRLLAHRLLGEPNRPAA